MDEAKKLCLLTRLKAIIENMTACDDTYSEHAEKSVYSLVKALNNREETTLTDLQIEQAILFLEKEQVERHRTSLSKKLKGPEKDDQH